jgi:hypothetical protein
MIDIIMPVYYNYDIAELNIKHFSKNIFGDYRLLVCDNTDPSRRDIARFEGFKVLDSNVELFDFPPSGSDGVNHGTTIDFMKEFTKTDIVGTIDSDFFWLMPEILDYVQELFAEGYLAIGCAGWYPDWQARIDLVHPQRAGHLAPVIWGQFLTKELMAVDTFVCTSEEGGTVHETGWRIREYIIKNKIKNKIFPGFFKENQSDRNWCFFGEEECPIGFHVMKTTHRSVDYDMIFKELEIGVGEWLI